MPFTKYGSMEKEASDREVKGRFRKKEQRIGY